MAEYIEKEAALKTLEELRNDFIKRNALGSADGVEDSIAEIENLPTADVAPVVHGKWLLPGRLGRSMCSVCRCYDKERRPFYINIWNYCPNCGARMGDGTDG